MDRAETSPYAVIVLAGGAARRLGGRAKPELVLGGVRMVDRVLAAAAGADPRIVVGPQMPVPVGVHVTREAPPGGGPVAALAAALPLVTTDWTLLLAADLPFLTVDVLDALRAAAGGHDGALLVDDTGRDQRLIGAWSVPALRAAVPAAEAAGGAPLYGVLGRLDVVRVSWQVPAGTPPPWWDCDQDDDVRRARQWLGEPAEGVAT